MTVEEDTVHQKMISACQNCSHLRVALQPGHPPQPDDCFSWLLAYENVVEIRCAAGLIRYNNGLEKRYKTKYPLTIDPEDDSECSGYEGDDGD